MEDRQTDIPTGLHRNALACNKLLPDLALGGKAAARASANSQQEGICLRHGS